MPDPETIYSEFKIIYCVHISDKYKHTVFRYGIYSNAAVGKRKKQKNGRTEKDEDKEEEENTGGNSEWARLLKKVWNVDPLECPECGGDMEIFHGCHVASLSYIAFRNAPLKLIGSSTPAHFICDWQVRNRPDHQSLQFGHQLARTTTESIPHTGSRDHTG